MKEKRSTEWEQRELDYVKEKYPTTNTKEMSDYLNRSVPSIRHKAKRLGVKKNINSWTEAELNILMSNYLNMKVKELSKLIPEKSQQAIKQKASELGLIKNRRFTAEDDDIIIKYHDEMSYRDIGLMIKKSEGSVSNRAQKLGISKKLYFLSEEEKALIIELYPTTGCNEIADILGIKSGTVRHFAQRNELKKDLWWSDDEIKILKENYENKNYLIINQLLPKRSSKAIKKKAFEFGLNIDKNIRFDIQNNNLKGRLDCNTIDNPNFNNDKGLRYACRNRLNVWRKDILNKQVVCQLTGSSENLIVHHLRPFRDIYYEVLNEFSHRGFVVSQDVKECSEMNGADFLEEFLNEVKIRHLLEDGILVEKSVHDKFHKKYGTRNITKEQFYEFALNEYGVDVKEKLGLK